MSAERSGPARVVIRRRAGEKLSDRERALVEHTPRSDRRERKKPEANCRAPRLTLLKTKVLHVYVQIVRVLMIVANFHRSRLRIYRIF